MPGPWPEPHSCPRLQSPARSQTGSLPSPLLIHTPTHPGSQPPPRERARNTEAPRQRQRERSWEGNRKIGRDRERQMDGQLTDKTASGSGQGGPGVAARRDEADRAGGRRAWEAGGTRRRFSGRPRPAVPAAPRASFHTSPPPAPSVRSREYPLPPRPHLLLPCRLLASRCPPAPERPGRPAVEPGPIFGPGAHSWPQLERAPQARARGGRGRGPADGAPKPGRRGAPIARAPEQCGHRGTWRGLRSDGG